MVHAQKHPWQQYNDESGALPSRFIDQSLAGLGNGIGIERVLQVTLGTPFQMLGMGQDPLPEGSSTDARGHRDAICGAREDENPRRYVRSKGTARDLDPL